MSVSRKCQYALRALYELARRRGQGPIRISEIADFQAIPPRFLELILGELKQGGFTESRRGVQGGYMLAVSPSSLTVGEIIRFVDGPLAPVKCLIDPAEQVWPPEGRNAFMEMWQDASASLANVYDSTSFQDLLDQEQSSRQVADYTI